MKFCKCLPENLIGFKIIDGFATCKACGLPDVSSVDLISKANSGANLDATLRDLLDGINRVNHATRALAISFVAAPVFGAIYLVSLYLSLQSGKVPLIIFVILMGGVVACYIFFLAIAELRESRLAKPK